MEMTVILPDGREQKYLLQPDAAGQPVSALLRSRGIPFEQPCGGRGICKKCRVTAGGQLAAPTGTEKQLLTQAELEQGYRYACLAVAEGDFWVKMTSSAKSAILTTGNLPVFELKPAADGWGIAVDIGTTTLAGYLYRLSDGTQAAVTSMPNPQKTFGADVISRLQYAQEKENRSIALCIRSALRQLISDLCAKQQIAPEQVKDMVVTGNTAMLYLLCQRPVLSLTAVPFAQDHPFGEPVSPAFLADEQGPLPLHSQAAIYLPRTVAAYVGADITTAMLACGYGQTPGDGKPCLMADIGTNGEMALWTDNGIYTCSTAAGPAFEGAGISCGMSARDGAIQQVRVQDGQFVTDVIGGGEAQGLCGSGLVDLAAALLQTGVMDETGRLQEEDHDYTDCVTEKDGQLAFCIPGTCVVLTQGDIRALQLAKAAIAAGMLALLHAAGVAPGALSALYLAGGFGNYIHLDTAAKIGLIPPALAQKAQPVGNAAGMGAVLLLLSAPLRADAEKLAAECSNLELSTDAFFMDAYVEQMMFGDEEY